MKPWAAPPRFYHILGSIIERAEQGERDKAGELLKYFASTVKAGKAVDPRVMQWVSRCIERFFDQAAALAADKDKKRKPDLEKAFGLKRASAGNPGGVSQKRRLTQDAHIAVAQQIAEEIGKRGGKGTNAAIRGAASEWKISEATAKNAYRRYKKAESERFKVGKIPK